MDRPRQTQNTYYLYLEWPRYLAQWYAHRQFQALHSQEESVEDYMYDTDRSAYELEPVETCRNHPERMILEENLIKQDRKVEMPSDDATICIAIPSFKLKDPRIYNRLSDASKRYLIQYIKSLFDSDIVAYINKMRPSFSGPSRSITRADALDLFMDTRGIDPEHRDSVDKAYRRAEKRYNAQLYYQNKIR